VEINLDMVANILEEEVRRKIRRKPIASRGRKER
jgi:hypothetical protein